MAYKPPNPFTKNPLSALDEVKLVDVPAPPRVLDPLPSAPRGMTRAGGDLNQLLALLQGGGKLPGAGKVEVERVVYRNAPQDLAEEAAAEAAEAVAEAAEASPAPRWGRNPRLF